MVAEAKRQEQFQLPREGESKEQAAQHARDNTATIEHRGKTEGGYLRVDVPLDMLAEDKTHVSEERMERLRKIGGTDDPIFLDHPIVVDGQRKLTPINGNNRIAHARELGKKTVPAYVTRQAWEEMNAAAPEAESKPAATGAPPPATPSEVPKSEQAQPNTAAAVPIAADEPNREVGPHGPIWHEYAGKPAEAIAHLQKVQAGEVPRVWHNADLARATNTDGWIGLAWRNLKGGLAHIIDKHVLKQKDLKLEDLAVMIPHMRVVDNDGRTVELESDTHHASVRLSFDDQENRWLVTAFEKRPPTGESPSGPGSPANRGGGPGIPPPGGPSVPPLPGGSGGRPTSTMAPENPGVNGTGEAPRYATTPVAYGREVSIAVPGEQTSYRARYAIREFQDVFASHDAFTYQPNPDYEYANERDYNDQGNAARVEQQFQQFDPAYLLTDNPTAEHGPPIVDPRGNVLGGNSRAMTLAKVFDAADQRETSYREALAERAPVYGIDPEEIYRFHFPTLVRELDETPDEETAARQVADFNKKAAAELRPEERAVADGRRLSPETVNFIAGKLENVGEDSTLAQAIAGDNGAALVNHLVSDGVITQQEANGMTDDRGMLTPAAKDRIAKMLVGRLFESPSEFSAAPPELRAKLEKVAPQVLRLEGRPEWAITPQIREAVSALGEARGHGIRNLSDLVNQTGMFSEQRQYSPEALAIARVLQNGPLKAAAAFRQYANDEAYSREGAQATFFTPPTRAEAFAAAFEGKNGERGAISPQMLNALTLGTHSFIEHDVAPTLRSLAVNLVRSADDVLKVLAPTLRGNRKVEEGKLAVRARLGEMARRSDQARHALRDAEHYFNRQPQADNYDFWDRIEAGQKQKTPALDAIAGILRHLLDGRRADVQALGTGKLQRFYENYMPRAWKDPPRMPAF